MVWQKATLLDMIYLQQDAFDPVDVSMSLERQLESFQLLKGLILTEYRFQNMGEAGDFFTRLIGLYKNYNYTPPDSAGYRDYRKKIKEPAAKYSVVY